LKSNRQSLACPKCGSKNIDVVKTWNLISPLPDREGRVTVTIMGILKCKDCGYSWRGVVSKLKIGARVEIEGAKREETVIEERPPKEIIIDLDEILRE
jgi:uncharacterized Zn finger protein